MSRPLSRVPFWWLEPTFPYLCALRFAMRTLVDTEVVTLTERSRIGLFSDRFCDARPIALSRCTRTIEPNTTVLLTGASNDDTPEQDDHENRAH